MPQLPQEDEKLLRRLKIPDPQKDLLQEYWDLHRGYTNPGAWTFTKAAFPIIRIYAAVMFALSYFVAFGNKPMLNIALATLWLATLSETVGRGLIAMFLAFASEGDRNWPMHRRFAGYLPGARPLYRRIYRAVMWLALFGLTAAGGYIVTSIMLAVCGASEWTSGNLARGSIQNFLEARAAEDPMRRKIRGIVEGFR